MKYIVLFITAWLVLFTCSSSYAQKDDTEKKYADSLSLQLKRGAYCGNKNISTLDKIKQTFPFNSASKVELISFKPHRFNPHEIDRSKIHESRVLDSSLKEKLMDVLVNYHMELEEVVFCYEPRNAILFIDKNDKVIANIMLCFACSTSFDRIGASFFLGTNCPEKWRLLRLIFAAAGIKYGVLPTPDVEEADDLVEKENDDQDRIVNFAQQSAEPINGMEDYMQWVYKNLRYPESAKKKRVEGKVTLKVVIERDGSLSNIEVLKGIDPDCDREAIRVISISPKWKPGMQDGNQVRQAYAIPIIFKVP